MIYFPFSQYWSIYLAFLGLISVVLCLDLGVFNKTPHRPTIKESALWSLSWVALAAVFNLALWFYTRSVHSEPVANQLALEFLGGYIVEKTLAIDNIFIFALVFSFFRVPVKFQHKILFWGIIGAVFFRGAFIALGSYIMKYHLVVVGFGILMIFTGIKLLFQKDEGSLEDHWVIKAVKRFFPVASDEGTGAFFRTINGVFCVTPMFLALMVIEISDIVFAVDSVPAIFALTKEPLIVFTSNILAILGLRSLYFLIAGSLDKFTHIKYGLAGVLVFVGLKMSWLNSVFDGKFPLTWSLMIIGSFIGASIISSIIHMRKAL